MSFHEVLLSELEKVNVKRRTLEMIFIPSCIQYVLLTIIKVIEALSSSALDIVHLTCKAG